MVLSGADLAGILLVVLEIIVLKQAVLVTDQAIGMHNAGVKSTCP